MRIGRQWEDRLRIWDQAFERFYLLEKAPLGLSCFMTMEHLTLQEAVKRPFAPAPVGTAWGRKWEYGWFRTSFTVPASMDGKPLVLRLGCGEEMLVFVNGRESGSIDLRHAFLPLTGAARVGETFEILCECYAGHGPRMEGAGIAAPGDITVPEPPEKQQTVGESWAAVWNEPMFQAAMDYRCLYSLLRRLPEKSLRAMKVLEGLKRFTYIADFELPEPERTRSAVRAAETLRPLLACRNGSTAPAFTVFGQSHLDLAWLWPREETERKAARTYTNQLNLMDMYPEYRFLLCEPPILEYLRKWYPGVYGRVLEKVREGAMIPEGAVWIEGDTNIPSGESLIRQFVWGRCWFRENMGTEAVMAWMPDTFGFSAALPQIMRGCGVRFFATQKLLRQDPEADPFPYNLFWWQGLDGSRVLSHIYKKNNADLVPSDLIARWEDDRIQQEGMDGMLYPFGYGDGGGGPVRSMLEMARRCRDLEGAPRCTMESPVRFFERALDAGVDSTYTGELYLAWHRGALTSQGRTKRGIRRAENALRQAEYHLARQLLKGRNIGSYRKRLDALWELLLFVQFHDIAAGTCIHRVHERAESDLERVVTGCREMMREWTGESGERETVYNHTPFPMPCRGWTVPPQGSVTVSGRREPARPATVRYDETDGTYVLQNAHITCRINARGEVTGVRLAGKDREYLEGPGNRLLLFRDVNTAYDAWEIGSMYENVPEALDEPVQITVTDRPDGAALRVERSLRHSLLTQVILLGHSARRLDFITEVQWRERHKLLKVSFPLAIHAGEAKHEIQFGWIGRPTHTSRQADRDRYEVCNHRYTVIEDGGAGVAVLNDGKYGVSVRGSDVRLTLLRAPLMPDMNADRGEHRFTYALYPFEGPFTESGVPAQAAELNEELLAGAPADREDEPIFLPLRGNVVVDTIKPADTVQNALLVRVYEAMGMASHACFRVSGQVRSVWETDMLEEHAVPVPMGDPLQVCFRAFEIKTFLLYI